MADFDLDKVLAGIKIDGASPYVEAEEESWNSVETWISTGLPSLDYCIAAYQPGRKGGIPIGKAVEINGMESCCKSIMVDHIIRETMKAGGIFFLCDPEHAHTPDRLAAAGVTDTKRFRFIERPKALVLSDDDSKKKKSKKIQNLDITLEEFFSVAKDTILQVRKHVGPEVPLVLAMDSLAAIKTQLQMEADDMGMSERLDKSKIMDDHFSKLCSMVSKLNGSVILVNQLRHKPGVVYGDNSYSPGGDAKNFAFSLRIRMGSTKPMRVPDALGGVDGEHIDSDVVGVFGHGKIVKNKLAEPLHEFRFPLMFSRGVIREWCLAMAIVDREKWRFNADFEKEGNTYYFRGEKLGIGEKGIAEAFFKDPVLMDEMEEVLFG